MASCHALVLAVEFPPRGFAWSSFGCLELGAQVTERHGHVGVGLVLAVEFPTHLEALLVQPNGLVQALPVASGLERTSQVIERRGHVGVRLVLAVEFPIISRLCLNNPMASSRLFRSPRAWSAAARLLSDVATSGWGLSSP